MLCLQSIAAREIVLPLKQPFRISSGEMTHRRALLLELRDTDGVAAWAECVADAAPNYTSETVGTAWLALDRWIAPRLLGQHLAQPADAHALLAAGFRGHRMAKAAVEMGLWAIAAIRANMSLAQYIGGTRDRLPVGVSIGIQSSPERLAALAVRGVTEGYRKIKVKIAPGSDVRFVAAARIAIGPGTPLMADANAAYTLADTAALQRLDAFDLSMIEQPLDTEDLVRHATLQRALRTPICLDESITSVERAEDMLALGSGRIINVKPGRVGGFTEALAIHDLCVQHDVPLWCGGMLETGIGRAYNVALASLPGFSLPGDLSPSARYWEADIVDPPWTMGADGYVAVPFAQPGLGVAVDVERIERHTVHFASFTAPSHP